MKLKSKSTMSLARPKQAEIKISMRELEQLQHKQASLEIIQEKVDRSKPILETIYEKVKRKERLYTQQIGDLKQVAKESRLMATQYKQLYEQGLRIMQRNQLVDQFAGKSNYRKPNIKQTTLSEQSERNIDKIKREYSKQNKPSKPKGKIDEIIEQYKHKKGVYTITKEEIYRRYMQKLGEGNTLARKDANNHTAVKQLSHKLLRQFDSDLNHLEKSREKSKTEYKPARAIDEFKIKERYLKLQKEKLFRI